VPTAVAAAVVALWPPLAPVAPFSWFIGVGLAAPAYWLVMRGHPSLARRETDPHPGPALAESGMSEDVVGEHRALLTAKPGGTEGRVPMGPAATTRGAK
jgi:hypothetical protein